MTKKELKNRIIELELIIDNQKALISLLESQQPHKTEYSIDPCPNGGEHEYVNMGSAGTQCRKCFKRLDFGFPTIIC